MRPSHWLTLTDGSILTRQEQFVLRQVAAGEIADLKQQFGEAEEARRLRARFLEELLTGELKGVKVHRRGVRIRNGVIEEPFCLENAEANSEIWLNNCIFKESVSFGEAGFKYHLSLSGSHFLMEADFHRVKVAGGFFCRKTAFSGWVDFADATINGPFSADESGFLDKHYEANFNGIKVGQDATFDGTKFFGSADFGGANIAGQLIGRRTKFLREAHKINFNHMQVGKSVHLDAAEFHGPVDFSNTNVHGQFVARGAKFLSKDYKISFYGLQVGKDAFFQGCEFHGLVDFVLIRITGNLHLEPMLKLGNEMSTTFRGGVNFRGADIGGEFKAAKTHFLSHTWVNFEAVTVGRDFSAGGAIFAGSVNFSAMQVKKNFYIDPFGRIKSFKTLFKGAANFSDVEVHGVFNADRAIFRSESVIFTGLKVGKGAFFNGTIFCGGLVLKEGQLTDLVIRGLHRLSKGGLPLTEIVLNRTRIAHRLTIEDIEVKRFDARNLEVQGPAELRRLVIKREADFRDAAFHHLQVAEVSWLDPLQVQKKTEIFLDGMSYDSLTTKTNPEQAENWQELLAWLGLSRFNTQNYQELDAYLQRCGLRKWADKVHSAGKRRELCKLSRWSPARCLTRFFWGFLAGFGRKPGRVFWPALALVLLGWLIYSPVCLEPNHWLAAFQQGHPSLTGLAVSLDRFLPGVDLGVAKLCQPGDLSVLVWCYWHFQKIMGWILAPIVLAAIYTRIK